MWTRDWLSESDPSGQTQHIRNARLLPCNSGLAADAYLESSQFISRGPESRTSSAIHSVPQQVGAKSPSVMHRAGTRRSDMSYRLVSVPSRRLTAMAATAFVVAACAARTPSAPPPAAPAPASVTKPASAAAPTTAAKPAVQRLVMSLLPPGRESNDV